MAGTMAGTMAGPTTDGGGRTGDGTGGGVRPRVVPPRIVALAGTGATAVALFALLTSRVRGHYTTPLDRAFRGHVRRRHSRPTHLVAVALGKPGDTLAYLPAAVALRVALRHRAAAGDAVLGAAAAVAAGRHAFRWLFPRYRPPTHLHSKRRAASYPSGHATGMTAVGLTLAHVLAREGLAPQGRALAAALAAGATVGVARVVADRHWLTDVIGGCLAGIAVASAATIGYELRRGHAGTQPARGGAGEGRRGPQRRPRPA
jgi:undecaprenyl-diphosphatase